MAVDESREQVQPAGRRKWGGKDWLFGILLLVLLVSWCGGRTRDEEQATRAAVAAGAAASDGKPLVAATPEDLRAAYEANEVAAQAQWVGRRIKLTGTISHVLLDLRGTPTLVFKTGQRFESVSAYIDEVQADAVAKLAKGQVVTVVCDKVDRVGTMPIVRDCTLVLPAG